MLATPLDQSTLKIWTDPRHTVRGYKVILMDYLAIRTNEAIA